MDKVATRSHLDAVDLGAELKMHSGPLLRFGNLLRPAWSAFVEILEVGPGGARGTTDDHVWSGLPYELQRLASVLRDAEVPPFQGGPSLKYIVFPIELLSSCYGCHKNSENPVVLGGSTSWRSVPLN